MRLTILATVAGLLCGTSSAAGDPPQDSKLHKRASTLGTPGASAHTINNLISWLHSDGTSNQTPQRTPGGLFPPTFEGMTRYADGTVTGGKFLGKCVVYADGLIWGGKPYLDAGYTLPAHGDIRAGGQSYLSGTTEGWITGSGAGANPIARADARVRVYRIRRDYAEHDWTDDYENTRDAAILFHAGDLGAVTREDQDSVRHMYARDWTEWPVDLGAPYIERNGVPGYQPPPPLNNYGFTDDNLIPGKYDEPGVAGVNPNAPADQVMWTVFNDLDATRTGSVFGCAPLGLEIQCTMWGYRRYDAMATVYLRRYRIINKGGVDLGGGLKGAFFVDSMYIGQWADPDIGTAGDDLCGCDPPLHMAYAYNGLSTDADFQSVELAPPALGYNLLQGPIVPGGAEDSATFNFARVYGRKNLAMTSFAPIPLSNPYADPLPTPDPRRWYRLLRGFLPDSPDNRRYPSGPYPESPYPLSGDPVTGRGFIDGLGTEYSPAPGDRRFLLGSGPFRLAPGDTQEVVIATVVGLGADNLSSVSVMRFNDKYAQNAHNILYDVPAAPKPPKLKATALNGEIVLEWGSDPQAVDATEKVIGPGGYRFEGYSVYQLRGTYPSVQSGVRIATFDVANDVTRIVVEGINPATGLPEYAIAQEGSNSGIRRNLSVTVDHSDQFDDPYGRTQPLRNGQEYYFAVTSYNYVDDVTRLPRTLESAPSVVTVKPAIPFGSLMTAQPGDSIPVIHLSGTSDQPPCVYVVDPTGTTGHTYQLTFSESRDTLVMKVGNVTRGAVSWSGLATGGDLSDGPIVDGVMIRLKKRIIGMSGYEIPSGQLRWADTGGSIGLGLEGMNGAMGYASKIFPSTTTTPGRLREVVLRLARTDTSGIPQDQGDPNISFAYRYLENSSAPPARPEFTPNIVRSSTLPWAYQSFARSLPLAAFDNRTDPPTRLMVGHLENNVVAGLVDGRYWPPVNLRADNTAVDGPREWFVVFDLPYRETPDPSLARDLSPSSSLPVMWLCTAARRRSEGFAAGDQFLIQARQALSAADTFRFTAPAVDRSLRAQKSTAALVGVFPNPYICGSYFNSSYQGRFVTFNNLPRNATLRIFNLAGQLVRTLLKDDESQFLRWDLTNDRAVLVASGMYIIYVEMPGIGATKVLKLAVIQEEYYPRGY